MNELVVLDDVMGEGDQAEPQFRDLFIKASPPSMSGDGLGTGRQVWDLLNQVHHRRGNDSEFVSGAFLGVTEYLRLSHEVYFKRMFDEGFIIIFEPLNHVSSGAKRRPVILYWDRQMTRQRQVELTGAFTGEAFYNDFVSSSCQAIEIPDAQCDVHIDGAVEGSLAPLPEANVAVPFIEAFVPTFVNTLVKKYSYVEDFGVHCFDNAAQGFFVRNIDGHQRNILWERSLQLNSLRGVQYLAPHDVPFDVVCGYIHGRARLPGVPLMFTEPMTEFLSSDPFSFEYFQATDLSVFMLADFAGDFSRLACLRDSDIMMREATAIFNAYLDENVRFAQAAMGQSYALLCESDPHERAGLVLSNFLSRSFFNNVSDTWADAELSSVAAFVANISARLVANQADLSVVPSCWYPYIARAMERAAIMSASYVPQLRGDQAARAQVSDNIHALRAKYADAADGDLGRVAPSDLGSGRGCINVMTLAGGSGLAENGRMIWREVTKTFPARLIEIDFGRGKTRKTSVATGNASAQSKRTVNVFAFNGDLIVDACTLNPLVCREDAYNIGFLLWETSRPPETYLNGVMMLDEIWVPATYLVDVFRELVPPHVEVINVGKHIDVRHNASYGLRDLFGIHPDAKTFLVIGDFGSSLPRKNIEAAVDAFQSANPDKSEAVLIIKIRKIDRTHWSNQNGLWERIERKIKGDDRIHILQGNLSTQDYWGLLNDIDCMMSLHRSEGFGYGIAHCHGLGKKTIVSDYSAVQDFCNAETSYLVPCEEVLVNPVDMNCREFIGYWGEADIHVAAAAISEVIAHERGPSAMGEAAKAQFEALYGGDRFRNIIRERLSRASGIGEPMPLDDDDEDEAWSALAVGQGG